MPKIAAITTAFNQYQDFENWKVFYEEYKDEIDYHIIVDNASKEEYIEKVEGYFTESVIIKLLTGKGITGGFNEGYNYVKKHFDADILLFILQDMHIPRGGVTSLKELLISKRSNGVVGPINMLENHSTVIREHGGIIRKTDFTVQKLFKGQTLNDSIVETHSVDFVCGGVFMIRREVFEKAGLYDEKIFLYGDESDLFIRVKKLGYTILSTRKAICWHEHQYQIKNGEKVRMPSPNALYYTGRNYFYLIKKHGGVHNFAFGLVKATLRFTKYAGAFLIKEGDMKRTLSLLKGYLNGLFYK